MGLAVYLTSIRPPELRMRRLVMTVWLSVIVACSHTQPFNATDSNLGPFGTGADAKLTFNTDQDYWPVWTQDGQGCPMPICQNSSGANPPGSTPPAPSGCCPPGGLCAGTLKGRSCTVGVNCPGSTLESIFTHVGSDPNCALQWNPSAARHCVCLTGTLWNGFVVYY